MQALVALLERVYGADRLGEPFATSAQREAMGPSGLSGSNEHRLLEASVSIVESTDASLAKVCGDAVVMPLRQACMEFALPALLHSIQDYTTDNRGDVGSLCEFALLLCCTLCYVRWLDAAVLLDMHA
jgi:hypothetical protein